MAKKVLTPEQAEIKRIKKEYSKGRGSGFIAILLAVAVTFGVLSLGKTQGVERTNTANSDVAQSESNQPSSNNNTTSNNTTNNTVQNNPAVSTNPNNDTQDTNVNNTPDNNVVDNNDESNGDDKVNADNKVDDNKGDSTTEDEKDTGAEPANPDDPSGWSKEQVVEFYKQAAIKSHPAAETSQTMAMPKLVVNDGDGAMNWFVQILIPVINSVLEKQATTYGGITGGFENLVPSDAESAKAYKEGNYTVVEMRMVEQTDGIYGDAQGGTVGHAINVLGNVATAVEQFPDFDIKYEEAEIRVHYADPTVKVRVNEDGIIEKGSWTYTAEVYIEHLAINSIMIDKAEAEIDYVITVGGGF